MAITTKEELLGTWVFNAVIILSTENYFELNFNSSNNSYYKMSLSELMLLGPGYAIWYDSTDVYTYSEGSSKWTTETYRTIEITDVSNLTNDQEFIAFMNENAVKQGGPTPTTPKLISLENLKAFKTKCDEVYKYTLPQATETVLGGIKAKAKTTEDVEVAIDAASGKLFVKRSKPLVTDFESGNNVSITDANGKVNISLSNVATLENGKISESQLPSYVDDVLEYANKTSFPSTGESGKIYVALDTNKTYRWSGSAYVEISESLVLGETSSTAYAGDKGKQNATDIATLKTSKQDALVSSENIKTINGQSLLGSGDIKIEIPTIDYATNEEVIALFGGGY